MYLANCTRPDIANITRYLSSFVNSYTNAHINFARRVFQYLYSTADFGLKYTDSSSSNIQSIYGYVSSYSNDDLRKELYGYSDASWADCPHTSTSTTGLGIMLAHNLILWKSVKQKCIAHSSMESEYIAMSQTCKELLYIRNILSELFEKVNSTVKDSNKAAIDTVHSNLLLSDNMSAIHVANSAIGTSKSRHIRLKFHSIQEYIRNDNIVCMYVPTKDNFADIFTKCLGARIFIPLRDKLMQN